ncbi:PIN domain-containing protein [Dolosigranulum pigrum]|uniref:PIN domain-containing protein n=1 Tax=Dolosigranulum pigrum TaxID=29394 RepID=UPI000DBFD6F7|nr:PIN domain-containing protein [Dolosigranulum pigrum]RAN65274.1 hypothetical protein B8A45_05360 [Dolosigranulum pigrum]
MVNFIQRMVHKPKSITLVDYENISKKFISYCEELTKRDYCFVFYSKADNTMQFEKVNELLQLDCKVEFIQVINGSANALDFQMSSYLGYFLQEFPKSQFVLLSNDKGFDPVVKHWITKGYNVRQDFLSLRNDSPKSSSAYHKPAPTPKQPKHHPQKTRLDQVIYNIVGSNVKPADRSKVKGIFYASQSKDELRHKLCDAFGPDRGSSYYKYLRDQMDHK